MMKRRPGKVTHSPDVFVSLQASGMTKRRPGKVTHKYDEEKKVKVTR